MGIYGPKIKKEVITQEKIDKYKFEYPRLKHVRIDKKCKGYFVFNNNILIGIINVDTSNNTIVSLEVFDKGKGYSKLLLDIATKELKANELTVNKKNELAISFTRNMDLEYMMKQNICIL